MRKLRAIVGEKITIEAVIKLYIATFGRVGDSEGIKYWIDEKRSGLTTMEQIASSFFDQPETKALYSGKSNNEFINAIYKNVLGRTAKENEIDYWVKSLEKGAFKKSETILAIINGAKGDDATLLNNKLEVGKAYFDANLNDVKLAKEIIKNVTTDKSTIETAKNLINNYGKYFLTNQDDTLYTTTNHDIIIGKKVGDLGSGDMIIDKLTDDNDTLRVFVTNDHLKPIIQNIENINIIGEYISTGLDLDNITGVKHLTLDTKIKDGTAKVFNETSYSASSIFVDKNVSTLKVYSSDRGTQGNIYIEGSNADIELIGSSKIDKYTVSLAKNKKITLNTLDSEDDKIVIDVKGDFELSNNSDAKELLLTINNLSSSAITIVTHDGNNIAKELSLSGNEIIIDIDNGNVFGNNFNKFTTTATKTTIKLSTKDNYDLHKLAVDTIDVLQDMTDKNITINSKTALILNAKEGNTTLKIDKDDDLNNLYLTITKNQDTLKIADNIKQTIIELAPNNYTSDSDIVKNLIKIKNLEFGNDAERAVIITNDKNLLIKELNISNRATDFEFIASDMSYSTLEIDEVNSSVKIVGGGQNDKITTSNEKDIIYGGAGDDTIYGKGGDDEIYGEAGNDKIYGGAGNDSIKTGAGKDIVIITSNDDNDTIEDFTKGIDKVIIAGKAKGKIDLTNLSDSSSQVQDTTNESIYKFSSSQQVTIKSITDKDLSNSVQLGDLEDGKPFFANGDVIAGGRDDFVDANESNKTNHFDITLGDGKDAIAIMPDNNVTIKDFKVGEDRVILYGLNGDTNSSLYLNSIISNDGKYNFYGDDFNITLENINESDGKSFVQLGFKDNYFVIDGNVTGSIFDDYIQLNSGSGATHIVNFINDGGFDTIKFSGNGNHKVSFGKIDGIDNQSGDSLTTPTTKVNDAKDGKVYIIKDDTFSCQLSEALIDANNDYKTNNFTQEVAKCINSALGVATNEKYITIIEGVNFNNSTNNQNDSLIYLVTNGDSGVIAELIGIVLDENLSSSDISTYSHN